MSYARMALYKNTISVLLFAQWCHSFSRICTKKSYKFISTFQC